MFIPNPWSHFPSTRGICKPGAIAVMVATRGDIEVPDGTTEVLLTPIKMRGRGKYDEVGPSRIWSAEFGLLDVKDHVKKLEIKEETAKLEERRKQDQHKFEERQKQEDEERTLEDAELEAEEKDDDNPVLYDADYEDGTEDEA